MIFLICHHGALGDFILTWPALRCLREVLPNHQFLGIGHMEYMRLAIRQGLLDRTMSIESAAMSDFFSGRTMPGELGIPHGAVLWLSKAEGATTLLKKGALWPVVAIPPFPKTRVHVARYYCETLGASFPITIPRDLSMGFSSNKATNYVLIHPGSGSSAKNYALRFYRGLADELRRCGYTDIRFLLGPVEQERGISSEFINETVEQPENVETLADLLDYASLYVGNDSGVSHLAGILGTPTIALYKTTDPAIWGTLGRKVVHIQASSEELVLRKIQECLQTSLQGET